MSEVVVVFGDSQDSPEQKRFLRHFRFLSSSNKQEQEGLLSVSNTLDNDSEEVSKVKVVYHSLKLSEEENTSELTKIQRRLFRPLRIIFVLLKHKARAAVFLSTRLSCSALLATLFCSKRILFLESIPWHQTKRRNSFFIKKAFLFLRDCLSLYSASSIIVRTAHIRETLALELLFLDKRIHHIPLSIDHHILNEEQTSRSEKRRNERASFIKRYNIPNDAFIILCDAEIATKQDLEFAVRVLRSIQNEKAVLLFLGSPDEGYFTLPLLIGMDLHNRVLFVDNWKTEHLSFGSAHIYLGVSSEVALSESLATALEHGLPVLVKDSIEMREVIPDDRLRFPEEHVSECAQRIRELISSKSLYQDIEEISRKEASRYVFSWPKRFFKLLEDN